jgi:dienelactone hydrolase
MADSLAVLGTAFVRRCSVLLSALLLLVVAACSDGGDDGDSGGGATDDGATEEVEAEPADFSGRGPYAVGEIDLALDADHQVAVFYPVEDVPDETTPYTYSGDSIFGPQIANLLPGALSDEITIPDTFVEVPPSDDGPFPVVLHSHGFSGNLRFGNRHNADVASWGYVVAAVDHPERGVVSILESFVSGDDGGERPDEYLDSDQLLAALDLLRAAADPEDTGLLAGVADTERVAAEGHSAGGSASGTAAYDDRVDLWLGQAPGAPLQPDTDLSSFVDDGGEGLDTAALLAATDPPPVPSMIIAAEGDDVVTLDRVQQTYDWLDSPKRLAVIADSGHAVFVDPCLPIREEGGLSSFVEDLGLDPADVPIVALGEDGCLPEDTDPQEIWPLINQLTVAQLEEVFGDEPAVGTASLDRDYLDDAFPGLLANLQEG